MAIEFLDDVTVKASALKLTSGVSDKPILTIECTNAIAGTEPDLVFFKNSASSAEADIGAIRFHSQTSVGGEEEYASILGEIVIDTDAAIQGSLSLFVKANNLRKAGITIVGGSTTNEVNTYIGSPVSGQTPGILRISDGSTNSVGFKTPAALGADTLYVLPSSDGTNNQVLSTDGSANLSWATGGSGGTNLGSANLTSSDLARKFTLNSGVGATFSIFDTDTTTLLLKCEHSITNIYNSLVLAPTSTTAASLTFAEGNVGGGGNYISLKAPDTLSTNTAYTLPSADGTSGQVMITNGSGGMSWGSSRPNVIASGGGQVDITTVTDANARGILFGGAAGFNDYRWVIEASATSPGATLGTPGTTTYTGVIPNNIMGAIFNASTTGTVKIAGTMKFDSGTQTGKSLFVRVYKVPTSFITDMANGDDPGSTMGACTLVAGVEVVTPSTSPSTRPMSYASSNGVSVSSSDFLFATFAYKGRLSAGGTTSIVNNFQLIIT
jgi:hypothetical protein